jgi:hypothetical protein
MIEEIEEISLRDLRAIPPNAFQNWEKRDNFATEPTRYPAKRVPELGKTLWAVYKQWSGVFWRR